MIIVYFIKQLRLRTSTKYILIFTHHALAHSILTDPLFTGFKPLPDEHLICVEDLLKSRRKYFKEGTTLAHSVMSSYTGDRRMFYTEKMDTNETIRYGLLFFIGTCISDWVICMM